MSDDGIQHNAEGRRSESAISYAPTLLLVFVLTAFLIKIFYNLTAGYELGDHGFYLLLINQPQNIDFTLTHFGLVWNLIVGNHGIIQNRAINIILLISAFSLLAVITSLIFIKNITKIYIISLVAINIAAASSYFASFILDPSYNSISIVIIIIGIAVVSIGADMQMRGNVIATLTSACALGFLLVSLTLVKASSAVALCVYSLIVLAIVSIATRSPMLFLKLSAFAIFGAALFIGSLELTTGLTRHVYTSFQQGLTAYSSGGTHSGGLLGIGALERLYYFLRGTLRAIAGSGWIIAMPVLIALILPVRFFSAQRPNRYSALALGPPIMIIAICLAVLMGTLSAGIVRNFQVSVFFVGIILSVAFWPKTLSLPERILHVGVLLAPFFAIYGTVNSYLEQILFYGVAFSLPAAWISISESISPRALILRNVLLLLGVLSVSLAWVSASNDPYSMAGRLSEAQIPVRLTGGDTLQLTPPVAEFVSRLQVHAHHAGPDERDDRPVVFDLTGQLPISVYLLNGRAPGAAWFSDVFGSTFSEKVFASLEDHVFYSGWVLVRMDSTGGIDRTAPHFLSFIERINMLGETFDQQFMQVAIVRAPYWGRADEAFSVALYKPIQHSPAASPRK